jgi:hypothetical protein
LILFLEFSGANCAGFDRRHCCGRFRQPISIHAAKNVGSGNAAELATYVVEKGKPLVEVVP